jgi:phosphatidylethanolamine-binding protein (PEBP) family uncharacterized protein|tara:strand:- start:3408 stop:3662 length:255 start_codon:yes stop_codon:yes gene_type:complete
MPRLYLKVHGIFRQALSTRTGFGAPGYGGPCPPKEDHPHRYIFTLFCLSVGILPVEADTSVAVVGFLANMNVIEKTTLMISPKR